MATYVNKNTLFITSRDLTYQGIERYLDDLISDICESHDLKKPNFEINNPRHGGEPSNHCFVWIESQKIVDIILDGSVNRIPDYEDDPIFIGRSEIRCVEKSDTLFCAKVPSDITKRDIRDEFLKFNVSDPDFQIKVSIKNVKPGAKICTVSFAPGTTDAIFAQQMKMFCRIHGKILVFKMSRNNL